jgi:hypothetical protein
MQRMYLSMIKEDRRIRRKSPNEYRNPFIIYLSRVLCLCVCVCVCVCVTICCGTLSYSFSFSNQADQGDKTRTEGLKMER